MGKGEGGTGAQYRLDEGVGAEQGKLGGGHSGLGGTRLMGSGLFEETQEKPLENF